MVLITVRDVNDNAPVFRPSRYGFYLRQNFEERKVFLNVYAEDPDTGAGGRVDYQIRAGNIDGQFQIHDNGKWKNNW